MIDTKQFIERRLPDFSVNTPNPVWSSHSLEELFTYTLSHGGVIDDVLNSLFVLLKNPGLSQELAHFLKDVAMAAFTFHRRNNSRSDLHEMQSVIERDCTESRAYLATYVLPTNLTSPDCVVSIVRALVKTQFWSEAVANLQDEICTKQVQSRIRNWLVTSGTSLSPNEFERLSQVVTDT